MRRPVPKTTVSPGYVPNQEPSPNVGRQGVFQLVDARASTASLMQLQAMMARAGQAKAPPEQGAGGQEGAELQRGENVQGPVQVGGEPVQRVPADFKKKRGGLDIWKLSAGWTGWGVVSPFKMIQDGLERYSKLRVDQTDARVEALMQIGKDIQRWWDHHEVDEKEVDDFSRDEIAKIAAIDTLTYRIGLEWASLGTVVQGTLGDGHVPDVALADPALTKAVGEGGKAKIGFFNKNTTVVDGQETVVANVNQDVLCMATRDGAPTGKQPIDYWKVEQAKPELDGVEIFGNQGKTQANFTKGYVLAADVTIGSRVQARNDLQYTRRSNASLFPLFPRAPKPADVRQIGLGDCYLQSALLSIAQKTPGYFPSIMKDNGNTVTVRLYDITPGVHKTFTARRITVNKSVVTYKAKGDNNQKGDEAFTGGALWAQMIEKAYVAAGYLGGSPETMPVGGGASYGRIESGNSNIAFEHILGRAAEIELIAPTDYAFYKPHTQSTWVGDGAFQQAVAGPIMVEVQDRVSREVQGHPDPEVAKLILMNQQFAQKQQELEEGVVALHENNAQVRHHEVVALIRRVLSGNLAPLADRAVQWVENQRIYPGKRGSGRYSKAQDDLYDKIKTALQDGKYVNVGSNEKVASVDGGRGSSGNEHKAKGLAGPHGYAVLDAKTTDEMDEVTNKPNPPLKMLKLRNPWGSYGRSYYYQRGGLHAEADDSMGEFWLVLSDLTKRFNQISIG
jgi:hypothetical protein